MSLSTPHPSLGLCSPFYIPTLEGSVADGRHQSVLHCLAKYWEVRIKWGHFHCWSSILTPWVLGHGFGTLSQHWTVFKRAKQSRSWNWCSAQLVFVPRACCVPLEADGWWRSNGDGPILARLGVRNGSVVILRICDFATAFRTIAHFMLVLAWLPFKDFYEYFLLLGSVDR